MAAVADSLATIDAAHKLAPEAAPVAHLRDYSNYLAPRPGLLSADTWTLLGTILRNVILVWAVMLPLLAAALIVPRLYLALIQAAPAAEAATAIGGRMLLGLGAIALAWAVAYIGASIPSSTTTLRGQGRFLWLCLLPLLISVFCLTLYWAWWPTRDWRHFVGFGVIVHLTAWAGYTVWLLTPWGGARGRGGSRAHAIEAGMAELLVVVVAGAAAGYLAWYLAGLFFPDRPGFTLLYACGALGVFLSAFLLAATLLVGFISRWTEDEDREWWARGGAWMLIIGIVWLVMSSLVIFGPLLLSGKVANWLLASVGGVSGLITVAGGWSARSAAKPASAATTGLASSLGRLTLPAAAAIFSAVLVLAVSWLTSGLLGWLEGLTVARSPGHRPAAMAVRANGSERPRARAPRGPGVAGARGRRRPRPPRRRRRPAREHQPVLAARDVPRSADSRLPGSVEHRAPAQPVHRLRRDRQYRHARAVAEPPPAVPPPGRPERKALFHVVNMALNLVQGDRLAWQDRKAHSFTVTPLHAGSMAVGDEGGYRRTRSNPDVPHSRYGGSDGISLGTAITISGAAASPNMGYHSSPLVTFLMTFFNARLGWWLGNPGPSGNDTFYLSSPRFTVRPIVAEAFGLTGRTAPYVYLSDGGHFDNLGLYEMVLRRCHLIVVSDGSCDADCDLNDLGGAIRKIRADLGIPIEFPGGISIYPRSADPATLARGLYWAVGRIRYSVVDPPAPAADPARAAADRDARDGWLLYIKAAYYGTEPPDVYEYARANDEFPHESTVDQFFSESQFESYRMLGAHAIARLGGGWTGRSLNELVRHAAPPPETAALVWKPVGETQLERGEGSSCEAAPDRPHARRSLSTLSRAAEGAVPTQMGPYPRSSAARSMTRRSASRWGKRDAKRGGVKVWPTSPR